MCVNAIWYVIYIKIMLAIFYFNSLVTRVICTTMVSWIIPIVRQSKTDLIHRQVMRPLRHGGSHFVIYIYICIPVILFLAIDVYLPVIHFYVYVTEAVLIHRMLSMIGWLHAQVETAWKFIIYPFCKKDLVSSTDVVILCSDHTGTIISYILI